MSAAFSRTQLEAALWAMDGARVHAVIDGRVVPGLRAQLAQSGADWDCLQRGALPAADADRAAYIAELRPNSPLLHWLIGEATTAFTGWGVLMRSTRPLLAMRELARELAEARLPDGRRRPWSWWDPALLELFLPSASPDQRDRIFAAGQTVVTLTPKAWVWWGQSGGLLQRDERAVQAG
jgi:hypothetical protein